MRTRELSVLERLRACLIRATSRIGRRGSYLLFLALLDILYGYSILTYEGPLFVALTLFLPNPVWAWIWIGMAVVLAWQAFVRVDRLGYTLAVVIKFLWATIALYNWVHDTANPHGWISATIWFAFAALTAIVSYWPEHTMPQIGVFNGDE